MIKTNVELWGEPFVVGGEWDAGCTPPLLATLPRAGRWTVRRDDGGFLVVFHYFSDGHENELARFPGTDAGEVQAKSYALAASDRGERGERYGGQNRG